MSHKDSIELILDALCIGLVYVSDCEGDRAFKHGVVRGQVAKIKKAIAAAEAMLTAPLPDKAQTSPEGSDQTNPSTAPPQPQP